MRVRLAVSMFALGFAASIMPVAAHHSVAGTYDVSTTITLRGVITKIEWRNPHTRIWMDVKNEDGTVSVWQLELSGPSALQKENVNLGFVKQGDPVTVDLWRAKDGSRSAYAFAMTVPDGRVLNLPLFGIP